MTHSHTKVPVVANINFNCNGGENSHKKSRQRQKTIKAKQFLIGLILIQS